MAAWEEFLNSEIVRPKLIAAGLFLIGHEILVDSIKRHPLEFFANHWTVRGAEVSDKYRIEIVGRDPQGKGDALRGSIAWLRSNRVITTEDEETIKTITDARNRIAHELVSLVAHGEQPDFMDHFKAVESLVQTIERWWIVNVELATDPDFDDREIDEDGIISGPSMMIQILTQVALGDDAAAWEFYRGFRKHKQT